MVEANSSSHSDTCLCCLAHTFPFCSHSNLSMERGSIFIASWVRILMFTPIQALIRIIVV